MNAIEGKAGEAYWMPLNMIESGTTPPEPKAKEPFKPAAEGEEDAAKPVNLELRALRSLKARRRMVGAS